MHRIIVLLFLSAGVFLSCSGPEEKSVSQKKEQPIPPTDIADTISDADSTIDSTENQEQSIPKVLIIPCANGYNYHYHGGVVNPSLEKYLAQDDRIEVLDFPYVAMKGAGYFGVYDKKHCADILTHTDADFLIFTRMSGGYDQGIPRNLGDSLNENYGFSTKILNTKLMDQFNGISAKKLLKFEEIDATVKRNTSVLVNLILDSHTTEL